MTAIEQLNFLGLTLIIAFLVAIFAAIVVKK
jgi:hypothetical protein